MSVVFCVDLLSQSKYIWNGLHFSNDWILSKNIFSDIADENVYHISLVAWAPFCLVGNQSAKVSSATQKIMFQKRGIVKQSL